jgi:hypothetical protein
MLGAAITLPFDTAGLAPSAPRVKLIYGSIVAMMGVWRIDPLRRCGCVTVTVRS